MIPCTHPGRVSARAWLWIKWYLRLDVILLLHRSGPHCPCQHRYRHSHFCRGPEDSIPHSHLSIATKTLTKCYCPGAPTRLSSCCLLSLSFPLFTRLLKRMVCGLLLLSPSSPLGWWQSGVHFHHCRNCSLEAPQDPSLPAGLDVGQASLLQFSLCFLLTSSISSVSFNVPLNTSLL